MRKLRIGIITQGLSFILMPLMSSDNDIVGIVESAPRGYSPDASKTCKEKLLQIYHRLKGNESLQHFAKRTNVPYTLLHGGNQDEVASMVRSWQPDLIVVYSMSQLLRESIFGIPPLGTINVHSALLPSYRGADPTFWTYYDMELNPGVTVHYINKGEDTGDIIEQATFSMPLGMTRAERQEKEHELALELLFKAISKIKCGTVKRIKQPTESPTARARNIKIEEAVNLIPWEDWTVERVWHLLRGEGDIYPFIKQPQGLYQGQVWQYPEYHKCKENHPAGSIYEEKGDYFLACKDGRIKLDLKFSLKRFLKSI